MTSVLDFLPPFLTLLSLAPGLCPRLSRFEAKRFLLVRTECGVFVFGIVTVLSRVGLPFSTSRFELGDVNHVIWFPFCCLPDVILV